MVHRYSNDGYVLLAEIATRATGASLGALARDRLFLPAAMPDTHFVDSPGPPSVAGWIDGRARADTVVRSVGDGGLISTASDLLAWSRWIRRRFLASTVRFPDLATSIVVLANTDRDGVAGFVARVHWFIDAVLGDHLDVELPSLEQTHGDPIAR